MQSINMIMIYYWDKKPNQRLHILEADITTIKKNIDLMTTLKDAFFTGRVPNDRYCTCLSNKSSSSSY